MANATGKVTQVIGAVVDVQFDGVVVPPVADYGTVANTTRPVQRRDAILLFPGQGAQFVGMGRDLYGPSIYTDNVIAKTRSLLETPGDYALYVRRDESSGEILGRMTVGINPDLLDASGVPYGQVGLFEVVDDFDVFSSMMAFMKSSFSFRGLVSSNRRLVRPPNSAAMPKFRQMDLACPMCR